MDSAVSQSVDDPLPPITITLSRTDLRDHYEDLTERIEGLRDPDGPTLLRVCTEVDCFAKELSFESGIASAFLCSRWADRCDRRHGRPDLALGFCLDALSYYPAEPEWDVHRGALMQKVGSFYSVRGDLGGAAKWYEGAAAHFERRGEFERWGQVLVNLGNIQAERLRFDEAVRAYESARACFQRIGVVRYELFIEANLATILSEQSRYDEAISSFERVIELLTAQGDHERAALMRLNLSVCYRELARFREALAEIERAEVSLGSDDHRLAEVAQHRGNVYGNRGMHAEALREYGRAWQGFRRHGNLVGQVSISLNLGAIYREQGRYYESLRQYDYAERNAADRPDKIAHAQLGRSNVYADLQMFDHARSESDKALAFYEEHGVPVSAALARLNRAGIETERGDREAVLADLEWVEKWATENDQRVLLGDVAFNRGSFFSRIGSPDRALREFESAQEHYASAGLLHRSEYLLIARGIAHRALADWESAERDLSAAASYFEERGEPLKLAKASLNLANATLARQPVDALESLADALDSLELVLRTEAQRVSSFSSERLRSLFWFTPWVCHRLGRALSDEGESAETARLAEALTYRAFQTIYSLGMCQSLAEQGHDLLQLTVSEQRELEGIYLDVGQQIAERDAPNQAKQRVDLAKRRIEELTRKEQELIERARLRSPVAAGLVYPRPATSEEVRSALPSRAVLLEYFHDQREGVLCALTTSDHTELVHLPGDQKLLEDSRAVVDLLAAEVIPHPQLLRRLGAALLDPVLSRVANVMPGPDVSLLLSLHGELCRLPFEALLTADAPDGTAPAKLPYLIRDHVVSYVHSGTVMRDMRAAMDRASDVSTATRSFVAFAFPELTPAQPAEAEGAISSVPELAQVQRSAAIERPLLWAPFEALSIAKLFALPVELKRLEEAESIFRNRPHARGTKVEFIEGEEFLILMRAAASEEAFKTSESVRNARIIHFACHAEVDLANPTLSRLFLAPWLDPESGGAEDGHLFAGELLRVPLRCELLTLAACGTSGGSLEPLEGMTSLSRVAIASGARAVLSTLWEIRDRAARELLADFYERWIGCGRPRAHALAEAKREAIHQGVPLTQWAPFLLWDAQIE